MPVFPPHGPIYEEAEFWYNTKEKALLYEVNIVDGYDGAQADHRRTSDRGHLRGQHRFDHWHHQPHGIYLLNKVIGKSLRKSSQSNIELLIRLWLQIETNEQPWTPRYFEHPLLPVPKALALFLAEKQAEMYKEESKAIPSCSSPTS